MKFNINKLIIWKSSLESTPIIYSFEPNKINVITGGSNTGKTCVLKIIDYCLFGKNNEVPDDVNERTSFYGIQITINNETITIGRASFDEFNKTSENYYFSEEGNIPERSPKLLPNYLVKENVIKNFLEREYYITENYELRKVGTKIKEGSRLKLEYFSIFNTISQNLILDEENFFDYQLNGRDRQLYREVLESIFDICIGISTQEEYELRKEIAKVKNSLNSLQKKKETAERRINKNEEFIRNLITKARQLDLVDDEIDVNNLEEAFWILEERINSQFTELQKLVVPDDFNEIDKERYNIRQKIRSLSKLKEQIEEHGALQKEKEDSLKPIDYLFQNKENLINLTGVNDFINLLSSELRMIKDSLSVVPKANANIDEEITILGQQLEEVERKLNSYPKKKDFVNVNQRNIGLIQTKTEIKNFLSEKRNIKDENIDSYNTLIRKYQEQIDSLTAKLPEDEVPLRNRRINLLNSLIQNYYNQVKDSLDNYRNYRVEFDYRRMILELLKPGDDKSASISGSSNYLFLQLCLFLGLHELFIKKKVAKNYVPQFLIIDYPSLPYKSKETNISDQSINDSDRIKLRSAFELLNNFIEVITGNNEGQYGDNFQIIILEHISPDIWKHPSNLERFHLVETFRDEKSLLGF
ncbi:hypothetical protein MYP_4066 [Sporocytophaga myxococcoides]|uniref:Rad50/SbcC-type AAA domain-containing protein n=1 Tax=Sporocytophaga myxococcoides TaxID=153721 RepID=A0A098LIM0_9BACT|nr:DUF3732 domain-containing protein [Sporocytophaga myxococcoides]GAL86836.1 hypothetical protein MYP_4066 [Sporocytophaga myxococcoides]